MGGGQGNSNALDIAAGLGLPPTILAASREVMRTELSLGAAGAEQKTGALMASLFNQVRGHSERDTGVGDTVRDTVGDTVRDTVRETR